MPRAEITPCSDLERQIAEALLKSDWDDLGLRYPFVLREPVVTAGTRADAIRRARVVLRLLIELARDGDEWISGSDLEVRIGARVREAADAPR